MKSVQRRVKILCFVWLISYIIVGVGVNVYSRYAYFQYGGSPSSMLSSLQLFVLLAATVFFNPMLFIIQRQAKCAGMKKVKTIARILSICLSSWIAFAMFLTLLALFHIGS